MVTHWLWPEFNFHRRTVTGCSSCHSLPTRFFLWSHDIIGQVVSVVCGQDWKSHTTSRTLRNHDEFFVSVLLWYNWQLYRFIFFSFCYSVIPSPRWFCPRENENIHKGYKLYGRGGSTDSKKGEHCQKVYLRARDNKKRVTKRKVNITHTVKWHWYLMGLWNYNFFDNIHFANIFMLLDDLNKKANLFLPYIRCRLRHFDWVHCLNVYNHSSSRGRCFSVSHQQIQTPNPSKKHSVYVLQTVYFTDW